MRDDLRRIGSVLMNKPCQLAVIRFYVALTCLYLLAFEPEITKIERHFTLFSQIGRTARILRYKNAYRTDAARGFG